MKRKVMGTVLAMMLLVGSCTTVSAQEAAQQEDVVQQNVVVQNYQQMMTPEILARITTVQEDSELDVLKDALVLRTDVWGSLEDANGDGIDDRDPINGCGYIDINYNGYDDRFEMALINVVAQEDEKEAYAELMLLNTLTHRCKHGVIFSKFKYDEELCCYMSMPDYFMRCGDCQKEIEALAKSLMDCRNDGKDLDELAEEFFFAMTMEQ